MEIINSLKNKKTKLVNTIGPVLWKNEIKLREVLKNGGIQIARLNFSHMFGTFREEAKSENRYEGEIIKERIAKIDEIGKEYGRIICFVADIQGPKIRIGEFMDEFGNYLPEIALKAGDEFSIDCSHPWESGNSSIVGIFFDTLHIDCKVGDTLLLSDGNVILTVIEIIDTKVKCKVVEDCILGSRKGINKLGGGFSVPILTDKDKKDIEYCLHYLNPGTIQYILLSFVRSVENVYETRELLNSLGGQDVGIICKIERIEAINPEVLSEITAASDGILFARGDLAIEIGHEKVPAAVKLMQETCRMFGKPCIYATQIMESMCLNPSPTRAECSDAFHAIIDGTDCLMTSGETANTPSECLYPGETVKYMGLIALEAEKYLLDNLDSSINLEWIQNTNIICCSPEDTFILALSSQLQEIANTLYENLFILPNIFIFNPSNILYALYATRKLIQSSPIYVVSNNILLLRKIQLFKNIFPIYEEEEFKYNNWTEVSNYVLKFRQENNTIIDKEIEVEPTLIIKDIVLFNNCIYLV